MEASDFHTLFRLRSHAADLGEFQLNIPGDHNVLNATAAIAAAIELGVQPDVIREGLKKFTGVGRRFEVRGEVNGITVVDDYGHHPTEIRATLAAAKSCCRKRIHVLFQPHRYTRTLHLMDDFARAFHVADRVVMLDIYAASEKPIEGVTAESLVERMRQFGHKGVEYAGSSGAGVDAIVRGVQPGDMIVTLGAGSVSQLGDRILERLRG
jgi:UDP-N-acetylmuramate--alanine ligase